MPGDEQQVVGPVGFFDDDDDGGAVDAGREAQVFKAGGVVVEGVCAVGAGIAGG